MWFNKNEYKNFPEGLEKGKELYNEYLYNWKEEKKEIEGYLEKNILV